MTTKSPVGKSLDSIIANNELTAIPAQLAGDVYVTPPERAWKFEDEIRLPTWPRHVKLVVAACGETILVGRMIVRDVVMPETTWRVKSDWSLYSKAVFDDEPLALVARPTKSGGRR